MEFNYINFTVSPESFHNLLSLQGQHVLLVSLPVSVPSSLYYSFFLMNPSYSKRTMNCARDVNSDILGHKALAIE